MSANTGAPAGLRCRLMPRVPLLHVPPTVNAACAPAATLRLAGCGEIVSTGALAVTVSVPSLLVALPKALLTTARKVAALAPSTGAGSVYVVAVAPAIATPLRCH